MFEDRIEDDQQLAHAGDQGHLLRFAGGAQALIEGPDDRIEAGGDEGPHVQQSPPGFTSDFGPDHQSD